MKKILLLAFVLIAIISKGISQSNYSLAIPNPKSLLTKEQLIKDKEALKSYHPNPFNSFPEREWDSLIEVIAKELPLEPIMETEKTLIRRKLLDRVTFEDPHLRFIPVLGKTGTLKVKMKKIKALPFTLISISDTLLIDKSFDEKIYSGDRILSINNVDAVSYLESSYRDRYMSGYALQTFHHFSFASDYSIKLVRNNQRKEIFIKGIPMDNGFFPKIYGNINENKLDLILNKSAFKKIWLLNKNKISTCKDCEFRYICSDCRAFLSEPGNLFSKPRYCNYDPYMARYLD